MSALPLNVAPIADRLKQGVPALRLVGLLAEYASIRTLSDFPAPCGYVVLAGDAGTKNQPGHAPRGQVAKVGQVLTDTFAVIIATRNYREQQSGQLVDELRTLVGASRNALLGFVPDEPGARAIEFVRGALLEYDAGVAVWQDLYQTQHSIGSTPQ